MRRFLSRRAAYAGAIVTVVVGAALYGASNPDKRLQAAALAVCGLILIGGQWLRDWSRRAFHPRTPEDKARAVDRQILGAKLAVGFVVAVGGLLVVATVLDRLG